MAKPETLVQQMVGKLSPSKQKLYELLSLAGFHVALADGKAPAKIGFVLTPRSPLMQPLQASLPEILDLLAAQMKKTQPKFGYKIALEAYEHPFGMFYVSLLPEQDYITLYVSAR